MTAGETAQNSCTFDVGACASEGKLPCISLNLFKEKKIFLSLLLLVHANYAITL